MRLSSLATIFCTFGIVNGTLNVFEQLEEHCDREVPDGMEDMYTKMCKSEVSEATAIQFLTPKGYIEYDGDIMPIQKKRNVTGVGTIIAIGKEIWDIVSNNKPCVDYESDWAGAVPQEYEDDWTKLTGWEDKLSKKYAFSWKVGFDTVSKLEWKFAWKSEGKDSNGKGQYVLNAGTQLIEVYARIGQQVESHVESRNPVNYGTSEDPMGGIDIQIFFRSKSKFSDATISCTATLRGDSDYELGVCEQND